MCLLQQDLQMYHVTQDKGAALIALLLLHWVSWPVSRARHK